LGCLFSWFFAILKIPQFAHHSLTLSAARRLSPWAAPCALAGQGILPCTPLRGATPPRGDPGVGARGNRGGPPRGVDVKPPRGPGFGTPKNPFLGSGSPFSPQNPVLGTSPPRTKPRKPQKRAIIPHFGVFWAFLGSRGPFSGSRSGGFTSTPRAAGWDRSQAPGARGTPPRPLGEPWGSPGDPSGTPRVRETSGSGIRTPPRGGFYINPSRRGPAVSRRDRGPGDPRRHEASSLSRPPRALRVSYIAGEV